MLSIQTLDFGTFFELVERLDNDTINGLKGVSDLTQYFHEYYRIKVYKEYGYIDGTEYIFRLLEENPYLAKQLPGKAVEENNLLLLRFAIANRMDDPNALRRACWLGRTEMVYEMLDTRRYDASYDNNYCVKWSAAFNHIDILGRLLKERNVSVPNDAIRSAGIRGNNVAVKMLVEASQGRYRSEQKETLQRAISKRNMELANYLRSVT